MRTGQVFVSHTADMAQFPEGRSYVQGALDGLARAGMAAVDMRYFAARDGKPADYCRRRVGECDVYVAVIGSRYGSLVPGETISYTELEFRAAGDAGLPRLVFLLDSVACPPDQGDDDRGLVEAFRQRLRDGGLIARTFASVDGLELEVFHALHEMAGRGGSIPQIWNVPNRNADFTGREEILNRLHRELAGDGKAVVLARALYGLGGVGKTQVALEYAHRFKADYDLIWWIPAEQPQETSLALANLAKALGLGASEDVVDAAAIAVEHLRRDAGGRWLLVFDNAEDPEDLRSFLPAGSGHIVITSRNQSWTRDARPLEVDVFEESESVDHLTQHVPDLAIADAKKIADAVGHLPLAIEQASAWLAETGMPAGRYLTWLATKGVGALALNKPPDYATPVVATWNMSLDRLRQRSPAAIWLMRLLAFCAPGLISMDLLYGDVMIDYLLPANLAPDDRLAAMGQVMGEISSLSLVKINQGKKSLEIHRLIQEVIRLQMTDEEQAEARHTVHRVLAGARPLQGGTDDPANWSTYDTIWAHLRPSSAEECAEPRTRELLIDWVRYQWKIGELDSALHLARRLDDLWTRQLGPDDLQTLHLRFHIANLLRAQGRFNDARELDARVLDRQREVHGADHLHALITANGLAADLRSLGDFQGSLALDREAYERFRQQFGEEYPRTLIAAHNLGCSLRLVGDCFAARRLDEEAEERQKRILGHRHPYTLLSAVSLANDLRASGRFQESVDRLRAAWGVYREVLGDDLIDTLRAAMCLAISLHRAGNQAEALDLAQQTYDRCRYRYGDDAPDTRSCALVLACACAAAQDLPKALEVATEVLTAQRARLGADHPNTLVAANNLGCYLRCLGRLADALRLTDDTLRVMRRRLGDGHRWPCPARSTWPVAWPTPET